MKLYIRSLNDPPHARRLMETHLARCGVPLALAKGITEAQALVYLSNNRCHRCFPNHSAHEGQVRHG